MRPNVGRILPENDPEFVPLRRVEWDDIGAAALAEVHKVAVLVAGELVHGQTGKIGAGSVGIPARSVIGLGQGKSDSSARALLDDKVSFASVAGDITVSFRRIKLNARCLLPIPVKWIERAGGVAGRGDSRAKSQRNPRINYIRAAAVRLDVVPEIDFAIAWVRVTVIPRVTGVLHAEITNAVLRDEVCAARSVVNAKTTPG